MDRPPKRELVIWNNGLIIWRVRDRVTRCPVFPGSHNSYYSYSTWSVLTAQIHTQQSECLSCRLVSHVNTVGYGLSECKQVSEKWMCVSNKWEAHMQTVVIPTPFTWFGCKYPQICWQSAVKAHLVRFIWNPLWWCIEPKMLELCRCPNIYGPDCRSILNGQHS